MSLQYSVVKHLWHIFRLYHRCMVWACDSEAIAESVGSVILYIEKEHGVGKPLGTAALVKAVRLRAVGVRGLSGLLQLGPAIYLVATPCESHIALGKTCVLARCAKSDLQPWRLAGEGVVAYRLVLACYAAGQLMCEKWGVLPRCRAPSYCTSFVRAFLFVGYLCLPCCRSLPFVVYPGVISSLFGCRSRVC